MNDEQQNITAAHYSSGAALSFTRCAPDAIDDRIHIKIYDVPLRGRQWTLWESKQKDYSTSKRPFIDV